MFINRRICISASSICCLYCICIAQSDEQYILIKVNDNNLHLNGLDAQEYCENHYGTDLASIHSDEDMTEAMNICAPNQNEFENKCYIGLMRNRSSPTNDTFYWLDGSPWDYGNHRIRGEYPWGDKGTTSSDPQPNDYGNAEDCVVLNSDINYEWSDHSCDDNEAFLCNAISSTSTNAPWTATIDVSEIDLRKNMDTTSTPTITTTNETESVAEERATNLLYKGYDITSVNTTHNDNNRINLTLLFIALALIFILCGAVLCIYAMLCRNAGVSTSGVIDEVNERNDQMHLGLEDYANRIVVDTCTAMGEVRVDEPGADHNDKQETLRKVMKLKSLSNMAKVSTAEGPNPIYRRQERNAYTFQMWLENTVQLPQYYDVFMRNGYESMPIIVEIKDISELVEIGIVSSEHQTKIMKEIGKYRSEAHEKRLHLTIEGDI